MERFMNKRIGIIGLGNVGEGVVRSIDRYKSLISRRTSLNIEIKAVCDARPQKGVLAKEFSIPFTTDAKQILTDPEIDIIVELIGGIEPAKSFICAAFKNGKDVVTANKALLADSGKEIFSLAGKYGRAVGFEASVCGAIPLIKSISEGLVSCEVKKFYGILNGTTNYILCKMEKEKWDFSRALKDAQKKGFAEADPTTDIEGKDTLNKLCVLTYLCFGVWPDPSKILTEGISRISLQDIMYAQQMNCRIKLLAVAKREKDQLDLRVHPAIIPQEHPLAETSDAYNAVSIDTDPAGEMLFYGLGAGGVPTSSAVISDIVDIGLHDKGIARAQEKIVFKNIKETRSRYYIRFMAKDKPGALAMVAKILGSLDISIASVTQKEKANRASVPIIMITHEAKESNIKRALEKIDCLPSMASPSQMIRIESI
jgi:homoserine dehydrogenase